ncbi:MAG: TonB-dependent receptor [Saprospiraceae bacterium]|nr:TonB-dependent receptor [Saprospiraceae bacterium]
MKTLLPSLVLVLISFSGILRGQSCNLTIKGKILDRATAEPLEYANVFLEEQGAGAVTDSAGSFHIRKVCPGHIHLRVSHIGCETRSFYFDIGSDTALQITLEHHSEVLHEIEVLGQTEPFGAAQSRSSIQEAEIRDAQGESLGRLASRIPGVSSLNSGTQISKPVIHGLYGNRIAILQNGVNLSSQRWGNDHSPEVAVAQADKITVLKGVDAIKAGTEGLGGAIILSDNPIVNDPHLHGWGNYSFSSNGRQHSAAVRLRQKWKGLSWKFTGGGSRSGDRKTPDYFLTNTGRANFHGDISLYHPIGKDNDVQLNYSYYNDELGILRGAHVGNLTDLDEAIGREVPFFTEDNFSYEIEAPRQKVEHHIISLQSHLGLSPTARLELKSGFQSNHRQEFDVRRGGRTSLPSLDLTLIDQQNYADLTYEKNGYTWGSGLQTSWLLNTNDPQTGIEPLIPDYVKFVGGMYSTLKKQIGNWTYEAGGRYDYRFFSVAIAPLNSQDQVKRFEHNFHNLMGSIGILHRISHDLNWSINAGITQRQPYINELYSSGLHQGVAGIEEGDRDLESEASRKILGRLSWHTPSHAWIEIGIYSQWIDNYIYLDPQDEIRLTIRGAFPVFRYVQDNVNISGVDFSFQLPIGKSIEYQLKGSALKGTNLSDDQPLILMPQNRVQSGLKYLFSEHKASGHISLNAEYVFRQENYPQDEDFLPPPDGYFLLHGEAKLNFELWQQDMAFIASVENALNTTYRNYLNRWRYFADETGLNVRFGLRLLF